MNRIVYTRFAQLALLALVLSLGAGATRAQPTSFTYQGSLSDGGSPASGAYDLQFKLFDALSGGTQIGTTITRDDVAVSNGIFTVTLDFGLTAFPGGDRFLEIAVRPGASTDAFTTLSPRQQITSTPYAVRSLNATSADNLSAACAGCVTSGQISSVAGNLISGAIPVAGVPAGSSNYIQNTSTLQPSSNFNISGNGFIGGNVGIGTTSPGSKLHVTTSSSDAVRGQSSSGVGVRGSSVDGIAVRGDSTNGAGVLAFSLNGTGVSAESTNSEAGHFKIINASNNKSALHAATNSGGNALLAVTTGTGNAGEFQVANANSTATAVYVKTNGKDAALRAEHFGSSGGGGDFTINNANNTGNAVRGYTTGKGNAGEFQISNSSSTAQALLVQTNAKDDGVHVKHTGSDGNAGDFRIENTSSSSSALYAKTDGTGYAANLDGKVRVKVLEIAGGADLSEHFEVNAVADRNSDASSQQIQPGLVVSIDPDNPGKLMISGRAYDRRVAGIISGAGGVKPGMLMSQAGSIADGNQPVALTGRVYCWVDASNGPIEPGDLLTTSDIPGYAMKVTDYAKAQGAIIGKAMTGLKAGKGLVLVLVTLQ
jgi:hypothetical protein